MSPWRSSYDASPASWGPASGGRERRPRPFSTIPPPPHDRGLGADRRSGDPLRPHGSASAFPGAGGASAAVLALALSIKPIVLPLLPLVLLAIAGPSPARALKYAAVLLGSACFLRSPLLRFRMGSGNHSSRLERSVRLRRRTLPLFVLRTPGERLCAASGHGFRRIPLGAGPRPLIVPDAAAHARSGLASQKRARSHARVLPVPRMAVGTERRRPRTSRSGPRRPRRRRKRRAWASGSFLCVFRCSTFPSPQLLFLVVPEMGTVLGAVDTKIRLARLVARALVVIPWQLLGWRTVARCLGRSAAGCRLEGGAG